MALVMNVPTSPSAVALTGGRINVSWTAPDLVTPPSDATIPSAGALLTALQALPVLPLRHYCFAFSALAYNDPLLPEYIRLTRGYGLSLEFTDATEINAIIPLCKAANLASPTALPVMLSLNYAPYQDEGRFPGADPTTSGATEIAHLSSRLTSVKGWIDAANTANSCNIQVGAVLFDTEKFDWQDNEAGFAAWNAALDAKYNAAYNTAKGFYPNASVQWFDYGIEETDVSATRSAYVPSISGWMTPHGHTGNDLKDACSCPLYILPALDIMRETMRRSLVYAQSMGLSQVTPWISLGASYHRWANGVGVPPFHSAFVVDDDFDTAYSAALGQEINRARYAANPARYAPWNAAGFVVLYPAAFQVATPAWGKHFRAYCQGAAGLYEISGYKIERESPSGGGFTIRVPTTGAWGTNYYDTSVNPSTQYNYRVSAINPDGTSAASSASAATTPAGVTPTPSQRNHNLELIGRG